MSASGVPRGLNPVVRLYSVQTLSERGDKSCDDQLYWKFPVLSLIGAGRSVPHSFPSSLSTRGELRTFKDSFSQDAALSLSRRKPGAHHRHSCGTVDITTAAAYVPVVETRGQGNCL